MKLKLRLLKWQPTQAEYGHFLCTKNFSIQGNGYFKKTKSSISNINSEYILKQDKLYEIQFEGILYEQIEEAEFYEMWSFVQNKSNQRWLWLAIDLDTRAVLAYTFEKRKDEAFRTFQQFIVVGFSSIF